MKKKINKNNNCNKYINNNNTLIVDIYSKYVPNTFCVAILLKCIFNQLLTIQDK